MGPSKSSSNIILDKQELGPGQAKCDSCLHKGQSGIQALMHLWSQDPLTKEMEIMLKVCDV